MAPPSREWRVSSLDRAHGQAAHEVSLHDHREHDDGRRDQSAAAPISAHWTPYSLRKPMIASGAVALWALVKARAKRNSFQAAMKTKTPVATKPVETSGNTIRAKTWISLRHR